MAALLFSAVLRPQVLLALASWPAEPSTQALKLTGLDSNFTANVSGACWNPSNRTFGVCCNNPGICWALAEDGAGDWRIAAAAAGTRARRAFSGDVLTNFVDSGGATNEPSRFYRVRTVP